MPSSPFGHPHSLSDCYATWYIDKKANELAGRDGFAADEADDIRQELKLHLLRRWARFDATKGKVTTFIQNVVDAKLCDMLRSQQRQQRDYQLTEPLSEAAEHGQLDGTRGQPDVSDHEQMELRLDCEEVLARLPPDLRRIAELLKEMSLSDAARELGIPKTTLWNRLAALRRHFAAAGYGHTDDSTDLPNEESE